MDILIQVSLSILSPCFSFHTGLEEQSSFLFLSSADVIIFLFYDETDITSVETAVTLDKTAGTESPRLNTS